MTVRIALLLAVGWLVAVPLRAAEEKGIWKVRPDGSDTRRVVQAAFYRGHGSPRWSPDGKQILFDISDGPNREKKFCVVGADGKGLKVLGDHAMPDWSPDGKQVVFNHFGTSPNNKIFVQNLDGTGREFLVVGLCPRWSPDGAKIAFTDMQYLKVLDLAESSEKLLVAEPLVQYPIGFEWSRDGKQLAFVARRASQPQRELILVDSNGSDAGMTVRYTRPGNLDGHVSFSPDGKQLVLVIDGALHVIDVAGNGLPMRIPGQSLKCRDPAWSPDGQWIAFARVP